MFLRLVLNAVARRQLLSSDISTAARPLPAPARTGHKPVIDPVTAALMLLSGARGAAAAGADQRQALRSV